MKKLEQLVIHCTATPVDSSWDGKRVGEYHTSPKPYGRGWSRPGYQKVIEEDGSITELVDVNANDWVEPWEISYGARGHNAISHHVAYIGGVDEDMVPLDTRTPAQKETLKRIVEWYLEQFPGIQVVGHRDLPNVRKACPSFDVQTWLEGEGVCRRQKARS